MANEIDVAFIVNGKSVVGSAEPRMTLADFLRDRLGLTGTHLGCEHGVCGACTVLMDGSTVRSCLVLAVQAEGTDVTTVEGLARDGELHPVQEAFSRHHALQCGFCTPGFLMTVVEYLGEDDVTSDEETIRNRLSGNLCRCTGYHNIVTAVQELAERKS